MHELLYEVREIYDKTAVKQVVIHLNTEFGEYSETEQLRCLREPKSQLQ